MQKSSIGWLLTAALALGVTTLGYPKTLLDSPLATYAGMAILEGKVLYRDVWDPRAPGVFLAYAMQIMLLGKSALALRAFDALWQLSTALLLAAISLRIYGRSLAGLAAGVAYLIAYFSQDFWNWAQPDTFLSLPLAGAFWFLLRGLESKRTADWLATGFFVGLAALFKLPYGLFGILPLAIAVRGIRRDTRTGSSLLGLASGFAAPFLICLLYFWARGALQEVWETQFVFAPAYAAHIRDVFGMPEFLKSALRPVLVPFYVMAAIGLGGFASRLRGSEKPQLPESLLVGWLVVGIAAFFLHGSFLGYHYMPIFAPAALLFSGELLRAVPGYPARRTWRQGLILLLCAMSLVVPAEKIRQHSAFTLRMMRGYVPDAPWRELGSYLKAHTTPEETIFVWGNVPLVHLYAERKAASRFLCTAYLSLPAQGLRYRETLLEELGSHKPRYFVLVKGGSITPALPDSLDSFRDFEELGKLVETEYRLEWETNWYFVYRRNGGASPP